MQHAHAHASHVKPTYINTPSHTNTCPTNVVSTVALTPRHNTKLAAASDPGSPPRADRQQQQRKLTRKRCVLAHTLGALQRLEQRAQEGAPPPGGHRTQPRAAAAAARTRRRFLQLHTAAAATHLPQLQPQ